MNNDYVTMIHECKMVDPRVLGTTHPQRTDAVAMLCAGGSRSSSVVEDVESISEREMAWVEFSSAPRYSLRLGVGRPMGASNLVKMLELTQFLALGLPVLGVVSLAHKNSLCVVSNPIICMIEGTPITPPIRIGSTHEMINSIRISHSEADRQHTLLVAVQDGSLVQVTIDDQERTQTSEVMHKIDEGLNDMTIFHHLDGSCALFGVRDAHRFLVGRLRRDPKNPRSRYGVKEFADISTKSPLFPRDLEPPVDRTPDPTSYGDYFTYAAWGKDGRYVAASADASRMIAVLSYDMNAPIANCLALKHVVWTASKPYRHRNRIGWWRWRVALSHASLGILFTSWSTHHRCCTVTSH